MRFLTLIEVLELHRRVIEQSGGAFGIREVGLLESASDTTLQATLIPIDTPDPVKPIKRTTPKAKLKADKIEGKIILDTKPP